MMYRDRTRVQPGSLQLAAALKPLSTTPAISPGNHMKVQENSVLLRIFIGESDKFQHKPLYEAIVQKTRELGLAGADGAARERGVRCPKRRSQGGPVDHVI